MMYWEAMPSLQWLRDLDLRNQVMEQEKWVAGLMGFASQLLLMGFQ
jgi:hypothetical protein